jgi:hypothetical protein
MSSVPLVNTTPTTGFAATPISSGTPSQTSSQDPSLSTTPSSNSVSIHHGSSTVHITEKTLFTSSWDKITLDITKLNWQEWSHRTKLIVKGKASLGGSMVHQNVPMRSTNSNAYWVWLHNDGALQGFLLDNISPVDLSLVCKLKSSHVIFSALRDRHENLGPFAQVHHTPYAH